MSKGSKVISVRFPNGLILEMQQVVCDTIGTINVNGFNLSDWIRESCEQRLAHIKRSRRCKTRKKLLCAECGKMKEVGQIADQWESLFGVTEYRCTTCATKPQFRKPELDVGPLVDAFLEINKDGEFSGLLANPANNELR